MVPGEIVADMQSTPQFDPQWNNHISTCLQFQQTNVLRRYQHVGTVGEKRFIFLDYFFFFFYPRWNFYSLLFNFLGITILTDAKDVISDAFTDVTSPLIKRLHERLEYANRSEVHRRLFEVRDVGYLHRIATLPLKYDQYQRQTLHVVKECPKDYIIANVMKKGLWKKVIK